MFSRLFILVIEYFTDGEDSGLRELYYQLESKPMNTPKPNE
ncbi:MULTISPECIES: hypothetical protein [Vibrio harveyi group]|nr:hypothetical protein [Vibrio diabolicus]